MGSCDRLGGPFCALDGDLSRRHEETEMREKKGCSSIVVARVVEDELRLFLRASVPP